jgi:hypothetical protein
MGCLMRDASVEFYNSLGPWVTVHAAADALGRAPEEILAMCARGELLGVAFSGELLLPIQQFRNRVPLVGLALVLSVLLRECSPMEVATMLANPVYADSDVTFWDVFRDGDLERMIDWAARSVARLTGEQP